MSTWVIILISILSIYLSVGVGVFIGFVKCNPGEISSFKELLLAFIVFAFGWAILVTME